MSAPATNYKNYKADELLVLEYLTAIEGKKNRLNGSVSENDAVCGPPQKPHYRYIPKGQKEQKEQKGQKEQKPLSKFHALLQSIKKNRYHDIIYYMNALLLAADEATSKEAEEIVKVLCRYYKAPKEEELMRRVYATLYDEYAYMRQLADDPILKAMALAESSTSNLKEISAYIKARLRTPEEMENFIGDTLGVAPASAS